MEQLNCRVCNGEVVRKKPGKRGSQSWYCSTTCRRSTFAGSPACRVFITECSVCAQPFASPYTSATCSATCTATKKRHDKSEHRHRRRASQRAAFVAPVSRRDIYERDGYRCHLCKRRVLTDKPVPHPRAATLDHVIPITRGGRHEPANVRTACFHCNAVKGNRGGNEQLMLIG